MNHIHYFVIWFNYKLRNCTWYPVFLLNLNHIVWKYVLIALNVPFIVLQKKVVIRSQSLHTCWTRCCPSTSQHLSALLNLPHRCEAEPQLLLSFFLFTDPKTDKSHSLLLLSRVMGLQGLP